MRRPKLAMTNREVMASIRRDKPTCKRAGCNGHVTRVALSAGWFSECECGARFDFTDPRGSAISAAEYEVRAQGLRRRMNVTSEGDEDMTSKKKPAKAKKAKKTQKSGTTIGKVATDYLVAHVDAAADDVIAAVKKVFPESGITPSCVSWYKNKARKDGLLPPAGSKKPAGKTSAKKPAKKSKPKARRVED